MSLHRTTLNQAIFATGSDALHKNTDHYLHKSDFISSTFKYFPYTSTSSISIIKSDNMWTHIGQLDRPHEVLIQNRFPIDDIIIANEVIVVRAVNGLCSVYSSWTNEFLCYLNGRNDEIIRSIYFNSKTNEILKISCNGDDDFMGISCYSIKTIDIYHKRVDAVTKLFNDASIKYPGFIEFDSPNSRAVVYPAKNMNFKVFSLNDYSMLYEVPSVDIADIKLTPGALMLIKLSSLLKITLIFHDINEGVMKGVCNIDSDPSSEIEFIERCDTIVVFKQKDKPVHVYDVQTEESIKIHGTERAKTADFAFLYYAKLFLMYRHGYFVAYSFYGEKLFTISPKNGERLEKNPICVSAKQDQFICVTKPPNQKIFMFSLKNGEEIFEKRMDPDITSGFRMTSLSSDHPSHSIVCGDEVGTSYFWL